RPANQDTVHAGRRLLAVADGYGEAGGSASGAAVEALKFLDAAEVPAGGVLGLLEDAVRAAADAVRDVAVGTDGIGTTLTALLWTGSQLALVHIGDTRAYLLRDGALFRITQDHTLVQSLLDEGRLTPEEAVAHPQRTLLLKTLSGGTPGIPDLRLHDVRAGDRYLLCSDGLPVVTPDDTVRALLAGGPDNIACVVADVSGSGGPNE
ncbi:PP2C family protein-serine/threonine phosphatase, partial [Streptomyces sp. NPDC002920]